MSVPVWFPPILGSAIALGFYDLCKKHAVRDNSVMPVLFFATCTGSFLFFCAMLFSGRFETAFFCPSATWILILLKSLLVSGSWICVYYAMRDLPISIASPIRATAPLWTFFGSLILFSEIPSLWQGFAMLLIFIGYYLFSVIGKREGISFLRHRGIHLILLGTLLGAASALYDKYLLGILRIPKDSVQLWFSIDLVFILGIAYAVRRFGFGHNRPFEWRWSIPLTGALLIVADWLYFYAVSIPDAQISILSLVRRSNCIVAFAAGSWYFRDVHVKWKAGALALILAGVVILGLFR